MKVAIISHSYLDAENQKNILTLDEHCEVRCILPRRGPVLIFPDYEYKDNRENSSLFLPYRAIYLSRGQYFLTSTTMGFLEFRPDVINIEYNPWSLLFFQVLLYRCMYSRQAKIVCTIKKNTFRCSPGIFGKIKEILARFSIRRVDHIIAASNMVAELCMNRFSIPAEKISVCHHLGVDVSLFSPKGEKLPEDNAEQPIVVGYCGRFDTDKGIQDLIEAVRLAKQSVKRTIVLKLMGRGTYHDSIDDFLRKESQRVDWLELIPPVPHTEVANFLRTLDIFVLPSRILYDHTEHDAHALLEAMACGVACIGTKSGIIPDILGNGAGWLVDPQDPEDLCEALGLVINKPGECGILALHGRKKAVEEFSINVVAKRKSDIFTGVVNER